MSQIKTIFSKYWRRLVVIILCVGFILFRYKDDLIPYGALPSHSYMRVQGIKPADVAVTAFVYFRARGSQCRWFHFSASTMTATQGTLLKFKYEHDFSSGDDLYELRIPYQKADDSNCHLTLDEITLVPSNEFDRSFAKISLLDDQLFDDEDDEYSRVSLGSILEARECNANIWQSKFSKTYLGWMDCRYYIDGRLKTKKPESNVYKVLFDSSEITEQTILHYNIIAGKQYRSKILDEVNGP